MIELKSEGTSFELANDTTISLELNNPMFREGEYIPGSYSLPLNLPAKSAVNQRKLQHPNLITNRVKFANNVPCQLFYKRVPYLKGVYKVLPVTPTKIPIQFATDTSALPDLFKNTSIRDLHHEITKVREDWSGRKEMVFTRELWAPLGDTTEIIVNGQRFSSDDNVFGLNGRMQAITEEINDSGLAWATYIPGGNHDDNDNTPPTDAIFKIRSREASFDSPLEVDMLDYEKWVFVSSESFYESYRDDYKTFLNSFVNASWPSKNFAFPMMYNPKFYSEPLHNSTGIFNYYFHPSYSVNSYNINEVHNFSSIIPFFFLNYVISKIEAFTGVKIRGSFLSDPEINRLCIFNTYPLDYITKLNKSQDFVMPHNEINPKNHLPDLKINDFFKAIQDTFAMSINYIPATNTLELEKYNDIHLDKKYIDITDKAEQYDEFDNSESEGISFFYKLDDKEELFKTRTDFKPYVLGKGGEKHEAGFAPVHEKILPMTFYPFTVQRKMLYSEQPAGDDFGARLFFFRGLQKDSLESLYPFGTSYNTDGQENKIGKYTLDWHGEDGLANKWWKDWMQFLFTRAPQKRKIRFTLRDLKTLNWKRKYRIDRVNYYIKKINVTITNDFIKTSVAELFKIK